MIELENSTVNPNVRPWEWDYLDYDDEDDEEVFEEDEIDEF